jgi:hypothetical protein
LFHSGQRFPIVRLEWRRAGAHFPDKPSQHVGKTSGGGQEVLRDFRCCTKKVLEPPAMNATDV